MGVCRANLKTPESFRVNFFCSPGWKAPEYSAARCGASGYVFCRYSSRKIDDAETAAGPSRVPLGQRCTGNPEVSEYPCPCRKPAVRPELLTLLNASAFLCYPELLLRCGNACWRFWGWQGLGMLAVALMIAARNRARPCWRSAGCVAGVDRLSP